MKLESEKKRPQSVYIGVAHRQGSRWVATLTVNSKKMRRGPFPLQGQAVMARRLMVKAKEAGKVIPTTTELKRLVKNAPPINGETYIPTMQERRMAEKAAKDLGCV